MREYELNIDEALRKGLSPEVAPVNSPFLYKALGFRVGRGGLEYFPLGNNPFPIGLDLQYSWPFPQFVEGEKFNFLVIRDIVNIEDDIYIVSDDNLTTTFVFSVDELTFGPGATLLEVADFGEYAVMTNGVCMIYWNVGGAWNSFLSSAMFPRLGTMCNFKGQIVGGNAKTVWYDCDETFYIWAGIGSVDFTPNQENEAGYRRCPFGGIVYHTRRLGEMVVGYSSKGITALVPVSDPVPSFGFKELSNIGIVNMGAMNGDLKHQLYVGTDYSLRMVTQEGVKDLGFSQWIKLLAGEDIIVTYDKDKDDFFIGNSTNTFLLSNQGLSELRQHPSAVWRRDKDKVHLLPESVDVALPQISSEAIDFGYKGQKTIFTVESDIADVVKPEVSIDYSNNLTSWSTTSKTPVNSNGVATKIISGERFRINMFFDSINSGFRIGYIKPRFKMTDLRSIRGVYAPPSNLRGQ